MSQAEAKIGAEEFVPKSILLTGGAGFIGSNVLIHIVKAYPDTNVVCLDKLDYCAAVRNFEEIKDAKNFKFVKGDITSADLVNYLLQAEKIDTIMHFAAQTHVDNSFGNSFTFTESNVLGTHVLLESAKLFKDQIRRFIHVSTDEVYGESALSADARRFDETSALNPTNPYAATKTAAEFLVKAYRSSFGVPVIITRGNNVFGPRQFPEKLIPKFISLLASGKPCCIHGNGEHRRSYIYVDDVARAFHLVLKKGEIGHVYNIGTDFEISTLDVARSLLKEFGLSDQESKYITHVENRAFNDLRYHISISKLHELGWKPLVPFTDGLKRTIEWYKGINLEQHWGNHVYQALVPHPRAGLGQGPVVLKKN